MSIKSTRHGKNMHYLAIAAQHAETLDDCGSALPKEVGESSQSCEAPLHPAASAAKLVSHRQVLTNPWTPDAPLAPPLPADTFEGSLDADLTVLMSSPARRMWITSHMPDAPRYPEDAEVSLGSLQMPALNASAWGNDRVPRAHVAVPLIRDTHLAIMGPQPNPSAEDVT